jgi:hypothetical protein
MIRNSSVDRLDVVVDATDDVCGHVVYGKDLCLDDRATRTRLGASFIEHVQRTFPGIRARIVSWLPIPAPGFHP